MSYSRGNGQNGGHFYSNITQPVKLDLNFIVDSTNGNGLGVRSIKSNGFVQNVFMHTSATPGPGAGGLVNPNPAVGTVMIQLKSNYKVYLGGFSGSIPPLASTGVTSTTSGTPYVITSLGTTTLAQWHAAGLIPGFTPTVGQGFVAKATGAIGGTGTVGTPGIPTMLVTSVVGDPNTTISNASLAQNAGAVLIVQLFAATSSSVTTLIPAAPADGTVLSLPMYFDISSVTIDGL